MIIGIDYRLANSSNRGMARYCREIVRCLLEEDCHNLYILYVDRPLSSSINSVSNIAIKRIISSNYIMGEQVCLSLRTFIDKLDVLWSPYNTFPLLYRKKACLFVTIHDLIFFNRIIGKSNINQKIGRLYRKYCLLLGKKNINHCFTVSEYSKTEIKNRLSIKNITVTPNCISGFFDKVLLYKNKTLLTTTKTSPPFFFTVSGDAPSKNLLFIINYFKNYLPDTDIYIAGIPKFSYIRQYATEHIIILQNNLSDEELIDYYSNCKAFLFLSLQEGFGIPILEALVCDAKIIASDRTSIPEIAGNYALLIEPDNEDQLATAIKNIESFVVDERQKKNHLVKYLSWKSSAKIVYQKICGL
jgi:glycosyltransferase involved in cell wall biosynthesis